MREAESIHLFIIPLRDSLRYLLISSLFPQYAAASFIEDLKVPLKIIKGPVDTTLLLPAFRYANNRDSKFNSR